MAQLMTLAELAQYLRFTKKTVYALLKQGAIPAVKIGNKWRFDREIIAEWLHRDMKGVRVHTLVIDDDESIRSLFKETLEAEGHMVVIASTSAEGLQYIKQIDFDLIFLDLKMPDIDGAELLQEIRGIKPNLPVTIITGYPGSEMMKRALKQGPLGIMPKPFDDSDIITTINNFLQATQKQG